MSPRLAPLLPALLLCAALVAGCTNPFADAEGDDATYAEMGFDGTTWPDLHGAKVRLLTHGAFSYMIEPASELFAQLTNGTLEEIPGQDAGDALNRALREKDRPSFDVVYGLDNVYLPIAVAGGALQPYKPLLSDRILPQYVFFDPNGTWHATPVDHGYIAVNVDPRANLTIDDLADVRAHANRFATPDPRNSSPGLGFLLATIATYGERDQYDWQDYWRELLDGGVTVTPDWTTAYVQEFTGGYGQFEPGFVGDEPLVTSYTTSPAYEAYYGATTVNELVLAPRSIFHQVEVVAIAAHARDLAAAQAFVEFTLTKEFQDLHAAYNAVYPVVADGEVESIYAGLDPAPGSFIADGLSSAYIGANVERWVAEWTDLYEDHLAG